MTEAWAIWLLVVGLAVGAAVTFVMLVRLPRQEDDVSEAERRTEAAWIASTIERHGGVAPPSLVEEVLELHQAYLRLQRPPRSTADTPPVTQPPVAPPPLAGYPSGPPQPGSGPPAGPRPPTSR